MEIRLCEKCGSILEDSYVCQIGEAKTSDSLALMPGSFQFPICKGCFDELVNKWRDRRDALWAKAVSKLGEQKNEDG